MASEKKDQTTKQDSKPQGKPLADKDLDQVAGGDGINYTEVKVTYKHQ